MQFCANCDNMYYLQLSDDDENKLIYYCRNCGNKDYMLNNENLCVSRTHISSSDKDCNNIINEYIKLDPTLPRINNINCPNIECKCNLDKEQKKDITYIRYDDINMKYLYYCNICSTQWNTTNNNI